MSRIKPNAYEETQRWKYLTINKRIFQIQWYKNKLCLILSNLSATYTGLICTSFSRSVAIKNSLISNG